MLGMKRALIKGEIDQIRTSLSRRELKRFSALHELDKAFRERKAGKPVSSIAIHESLMWLDLVDLLDRRHPLTDTPMFQVPASSFLIGLMDYIDAGARDLISSLFIDEPWLTRLAAYRHAFSVPDESVGKLVPYGQLHRFCVKFDELQEIRKSFEPERIRAREMRRIQKAKATEGGMARLSGQLRHVAILNDLDI